MGGVHFNNNFAYELVTLFVILDPVATVPIFLFVTAGLARKDQKGRLESVFSRMRIPIGAASVSVEFEAQCDAAVGWGAVGQGVGLHTRAPSLDTRTKGRASLPYMTSCSLSWVGNQTTLP